MSFLDRFLSILSSFINIFSVFDQFSARLTAKLQKISLNRQQNHKKLSEKQKKITKILSFYSKSITKIKKIFSFYCKKFVFVNKNDRLTTKNE